MVFCTNLQYGIYRCNTILCSTSKIVFRKMLFDLRVMHETQIFLLPFIIVFWIIIGCFNESLGARKTCLFLFIDQQKVWDNKSSNFLAITFSVKIVRASSLSMFSSSAIVRWI